MENAVFSFKKRARNLKIIFIILFVLLCLLEVYSLGVTLWRFTPFAAEEDIRISFHTDGYGNRLATKIEFDSYIPYIQLSSNIMSPTDDFIPPVPTAVNMILIIGTVMKLPILLGLWWSIDIFSTLEKSETPFMSDLFSKIKSLGKLTILYGLLANLILSILIAIFVTGELRAMNPVNLYVVIIGLVLYIVSEILEYGVGLQTEVDGLL